MSTRKRSSAARTSSTRPATSRRPLTRRTFLAESTAAALAWQAGAALAAVPLEPAPSRPEKLISLGGSTALIPASVHDYRFWSNREDVLATGTPWVKIWLGWDEVQGGYRVPRTLQESWAQLNAGVPGALTSESKGLRVIDGQIAAANRDGVRVILCLQSGYPEWARRGRGLPVLSAPKGYVGPQQLPADLAPDSPFGWFVAHLASRYGRREGGAPFVDAIEVSNEPNLLAWPEQAAPRAAAEMMRTADAWSARLEGPAILGPGTSDTDGRSRGTHYLDFTRAVLGELRAWQPRGRVGWSHHNYGDTKYGGTPRLGAVRDALEEAGWPDRDIWLTEGGYDTTDHGQPQTTVTAEAKALQARLIERSYRDTAAFSAAAEREGRIGRVRTFSHHVIHDQDDPTNTFKSGLRDDFRFDTEAIGARRPAWFVWRDLS